MIILRYAVAHLIFISPLLCLTELMESTNTALWPVKLALEVADWFILLSFIVEILLMWLASFSLFWKDAWNVFDFFVTLLVRIDTLKLKGPAMCLGKLN